MPRRHGSSDTKLNAAMVSLSDIALPEHLLSVTFSTSSNGDLLVEQHLRDGRHVKVRVQSAPFAIELAADGGGQWSIEARYFGSDTSSIGLLSSEFQAAGGSHIGVIMDPFDFGPNYE